ncbi:HAMP domain-containing protein [Deltaproteobacteria bacterium IMCC39524]|nr:HAMP domain-containing protein [Deltaproteobacteria bacterium IMCC39524]
MAPAAVLFLMTLLLCFLQFTYWDLSVKRQQAKNLKTAFIALAEADMASQRMEGIVGFLAQAQMPDAKAVQQLSFLHEHLSAAFEQLLETELLGVSDTSLLRQSVRDLNPEQGVNLDNLAEGLKLLRPNIKKLLNSLNQQRLDFGALHQEDIEELVAETTFVTIVVLGIAILIGIFLSLAFARNILSRIKILSDSAARITAGEFVPPPAPDKVRDELDGLAVSINQMTDQLIRVVASEKLLEGAEEERRRIAMDIHDQTLAELSAVRRKIEHLREQSSFGKEALSIETDLQKTMTNLRVVMDNLHPQTLDILGLPAAIESMLDKVCEPPGTPTYHFMAGDDVAKLQLPRLTQVTVYRIIVEAVNNVLRHAHANQMEVAMSLRSNTLIVIVEDNGQGFNHTPQLPTESGGRGVHNVQERARAIGGQVRWQSSRFSSGTRFELELPLNEG